MTNLFIIEITFCLHAKDDNNNEENNAILYKHKGGFIQYIDIQNSKETQHGILFLGYVIDLATSCKVAPRHCSSHIVAHV